MSRERVPPERPSVSIPPPASVNRGKTGTEASAMGFDTRTTELIAIGASVAANCQACLQYHVDKARENEVAPEEIAEAIEVGRAVGRGAASGMKRFVSTLTAASSSAAAPIPQGCGCPP